jgi:RNA polymerase sigma factor (sigma-70 family)
MPRRPKRLLATAGDERLVEQIRRGSEAAFEVAFERHGKGILSFCRHMLGSQDEAEDVVQHTFAAAYRDLLRDQRAIKLKPWLYTIARNRCLSVLRARREDLLESPEVPTAGLHDQVQQRADLRELLHDLRELPDEQRAALLLAEVGDMPHAEIAQVLDCEAAKVKALVFRARSGLIERRQARETPCEEIREQLASLSGGALRRSQLRHHLRGCAGCREFREEMGRQRSMLGLALPVTPSLALKSSVMGALGLGGGALGGGALGGGAAAGGLGAAAAGPASSALLAKVAVVGVLAGGGVVAGDALLQQPHATRAPASPTEPHRAAAPNDTTGAPGAPRGEGAGARTAHGFGGLKKRGGGRTGRRSAPPAAHNEHAGPKPARAKGHASPRGRPARGKPPVRRHGAGVRSRPKKAKPPKAEPPRAQASPPGKPETPPGQEKK